MKSLLEQVNELDTLIRSLEKTLSKMRVGQFIDAWREIQRIIAGLKQAKDTLIKGSEGKDAE